jgi:hypothetical protein
MLVIRGGQPVAALVPVDASRVEDLALANAPQFAASLARADEAARTGDTSTLDEIFDAKTTEGGPTEFESISIRELAEPLSGVAMAYAERLAEETSTTLQGEPMASQDVTSREQGGKVKELLAAVVSYALTQSVSTALARTRTINENLIEASREAGTAELENYEELLVRVADVERLASVSPQAADDLVYSVESLVTARYKED